MWETVESYNIRLQVDLKQSRPKNTNKYFLANNKTTIKKKRYWNQNASSSFKGILSTVLILIFPDCSNFLRLKI